MKTSTSSLTNSNTLQAGAIGHRLYERLSSLNIARVTNFTPQAVTLLFASQYVAFITYESYRGPLNINFANPNVAHFPVFTGQEVRFQPDEITFTSLQTHLLLTNTPIWEPPASPQTTRPLTDVLATMKHLVLHTMRHHRGAGFVPLMAYIIDLPERPTLPAGLQNTIMNVLILKELFNRPLVASVPALSELIGMPRGTSPSADDLIVGLLLFLNRFPQRQNFLPDLQEFNQAIIEMAYAKTTAVSANRIDCAASGSADERLVRVVDSILMGSLDEGEIIHLLETFTDTIGCDALAGFALALNAYTQRSGPSISA
jgi:hypothetical protein